MDVPLRDLRLETERLVLRLYREDDFPAYFEMMSDPETFRFSERGPMSGDEAWTRMLRQVGHWALLGHGLFAVEEKATGRFVGEAGLGDFRRGFGPEFDAFPEASWTTVSAARGRGYASEASAAAHRWAESALGARRTVCLIHADNLVSIRIADRLGYTPYSERLYRGYPATLFEREAPGPPGS